MKYKILVNKDNKIKKNYLSKIELITIKNINNENIQIEKETYDAYEKLKNYLQYNNIFIGIRKAYENIIKPGDEYSEHSTGLAIDLSIKIESSWLFDNSELLKHISIFKKIAEHLADFGFILRYPEDKEKITSSSYKPWHIRYVGKIVAKIIMNNKYTLEEYLTNYAGIIVVNKPAGITSFDIVHIISKILGIKKIGHTGTLDPLATGVLVVTVGKATKIGEELTATYKEYEAGVLLGLETDTLDITGKTLKTKKVSPNLPVENVLASFKKTYLQEVPIYSAVKVGGKKLYEYARQNKEIVLPKKEVTIKEISLIQKENNSFTFKSVVSKGCYIRSLIRDIGYSLNTYATMTSLIRTKQGKFKIEEANLLEDIKKGEFTLHKIEDVLDYPKIRVNKEIEYKIRTGQKLKDLYNIENKVIFLDQHNNLLSIYQKEDSNLRVWKNFVN